MSVVIILNRITIIISLGFFMTVTVLKGIRIEIRFFWVVINRLVFKAFFMNYLMVFGLKWRFFVAF